MTCTHCCWRLCLQIVARCLVCSLSLERGTCSCYGLSRGLLPVPRPKSLLHNWVPCQDLSNSFPTDAIILHTTVRQHTIFYSFVAIKTAIDPWIFLVWLLLRSKRPFQLIRLIICAINAFLSKTNRRIAANQASQDSTYSTSSLLAPDMLRYTHEDKTQTVGQWPVNLLRGASS